MINIRKYVLIGAAILLPGLLPAGAVARPLMGAALTTAPYVGGQTGRSDDRDAGGQTWRGEEREAYNRGYNDGYTDGSRNRSSDYRRYRDHFNSSTERAYRNGYEDGFDDFRQIRERRGQSIDEQREAYDAGYGAGKRDYRLNYGKNATRHRDMYEPRTERSFIRGYEAGYEAKQITTGTFSAREKEVYDNGVRIGEEDFRARMTPNYLRHQNQFDRRYESAFSRGYQEGFDKAREQGREVRGSEKSYYDAGFSRGQDDRRHNRSRDYRRYRREYDSSYEEAFRRGYDAGYDDRGGSGSEQSVYDQGYRLGREDRTSRQARDYRRWRQYFDSRTETAFRRGYEAGYDSR
jgi:flagellar biosynthesis/type III secretory pathway protein FliH